jgi:hypothetical protein
MRIGSEAAIVIERTYDLAGAGEALARINEGTCGASSRSRSAPDALAHDELGGAE